MNRELTQGAWRGLSAWEAGEPTVRWCFQVQRWLFEVQVGGFSEGRGPWRAEHLIKRPPANVADA